GRVRAPALQRRLGGCGWDARTTRVEEGGRWSVMAAAGEGRALRGVEEEEEVVVELGEDDARQPRRAGPPRTAVV
ncbi:MAG: hypothetical protein ABFD96_03885, partial [Armatimonadia bacterium]